MSPASMTTCQQRNCILGITFSVTAQILFWPMDVNVAYDPIYGPDQMHNGPKTTLLKPINPAIRVCSVHRNCLADTNSTHLTPLNHCMQNPILSLSFLPFHFQQLSLFPISFIFPLSKLPIFKQILHACVDSSLVWVVVERIQKIQPRRSEIGMRLLEFRHRELESRQVINIMVLEQPSKQVCVNLWSCTLILQ